MIVKNNESNKLMGMRYIRNFLQAENRMLRAQIEMLKAEKQIEVFEQNMKLIQPIGKLTTDLDFEVPDGD